jgi:4-coumarate--CoA ligase
VIYQCPVTGRNYTYASLKKATIQFGLGLRAHFDWKLNDVLAIFCQNCIDTPAVTWGAHWAGGIVSPANPAYTVRELAHHLRDSGSRVLVTQKHLLGVALKAAAEVGIERERVLLIGDEREEGFRHFEDVLVKGENGKEKGEERTRINCEKDLSFLVYSSGTTGLPKGVMLTHLNVVSDLFMVNSSEGTLLRWDRDKILSVLPYYHIYGSSLQHPLCHPMISILLMTKHRTAMSDAFPYVRRTNHNRNVSIRP